MSSATMAVSRLRSSSDLTRRLLSSGSAASYPFLPKDTLHTMETSAAPMAPMMAAALPPPGVGSPLARRSRNASRELCVIMRIFRGGGESTDHRFGLGVDLFGVENEIVLLEQPPDAGAMQRQLQGTETQGAK